MAVSAQWSGPKLGHAGLGAALFKQVDARPHLVGFGSFWAPRARNEALVGRGVTGGRRPSSPDARFYDKDVSSTQEVFL